MLVGEGGQLGDPRPQVDVANVEALGHAELRVGLVVHLAAQALVCAHFDQSRLQFAEVFLLLPASSVL